MAQRNSSLRSGNQLKLGIFGANCSSGRSYNTTPERWDTTWENNVRLAQMADEAGIECMVPIARWKGYGGESDPNGTSWESITWACGLLAATSRINVFATVHVPLNHPIVAAKQMVTADHIGRGRFGVNVVCGRNDDEFQMFGVEKKEHRFAYEEGEEWWQIVKRIWAGESPFDFEGRFYQLHGVEGSPRPFGGEAPIMMNAGTSTAGRAFAMRYSDLHFDGAKMPEESVNRIAETRRAAKDAGREVQVWTPIGVVCRPTQREAEEFTRYIVQHMDPGAIGHLSERQQRDVKERADPESMSVVVGEGPVERAALARGNYCAIGDPDRVASQMARLQSVGFDGLAVSLVNYLDDFPFFAQEVLPRLERMGSRSKAVSSGRSGLTS